MSDTREMDKLSAVSDERRVLVDFFDWLEQQRMEVCLWGENDRHPTPILEKSDALIYRFLGIDAKQLEKERRALLESLR